MKIRDAEVGWFVVPYGTMVHLRLTTRERLSTLTVRSTTTSTSVESTNRNERSSILLLESSTLHSHYLERFFVLQNSLHSLTATGYQTTQFSWRKLPFSPHTSSSSSSPSKEHDIHPFENILFTVSGATSSLSNMYCHGSD